MDGQTGIMPFAVAEGFFAGAGQTRSGRDPDAIQTQFRPDDASTAAHVASGSRSDPAPRHGAC
jgi:hypothetical protein